MKKKMNNKGFTLVELIVVLVILAILAAILVPTLLGYIERARSEKDFSTAQAVRVAVQSEVAELYGKGNDTVEGTDITGTTDEAKAALAQVFKLVGATKDGNDYKLDGQIITIAGLTITNNQVTEIKVTIDGKGYSYNSSKNEWSSYEVNNNTSTTTPNG